MALKRRNGGSKWVGACPAQSPDLLKELVSLLKLNSILLYGVLAAFVIS